MKQQDRTTESYITGHNEAITRFLQEIRTGLHKISPLSLTKIRDGRGGEVVGGAKRRSYAEKAFGEEYISDHQRAIDDIETMQTNGRLVSPFAKRMSVELRSGGEGGQIQNITAYIEDVKARYDNWFGFCEGNHLYARTATILVFGEGCGFTEASQIMRGRGMSVSKNSIMGLCYLGIVLYEERTRIFLRKKKNEKTIDAEGRK